jgi:hypothetical protein
MVALIFLRIVRIGETGEFPPVSGPSPIGAYPKLDSEREARQRHGDPQHGGGADQHRDRERERAGRSGQQDRRAKRT